MHILPGCKYKNYKKKKWPKICKNIQNKIRIIWIKEAQNKCLAKIALYKIKGKKVKVINILTLFIIMN
jgi:hypothetical protein